MPPSAFLTLLRRTQRGPRGFQGLDALKCFVLCRFLSGKALVAANPLLCAFPPVSELQTLRLKVHPSFAPKEQKGSPLPLRHLEPVSLIPWDIAPGGHGAAVTPQGFSVLWHIPHHSSDSEGSRIRAQQDQAPRSMCCSVFLTLLKARTAPKCPELLRCDVAPWTSSNPHV